MQGALVEVVKDVRDGRADRTIGEIYQAVSPRLPALIVAGILAGLGIAVGLILLIVPGLFLLTIWSMLVAVIVIEGKSAGEAFGRSREIVRGHGWEVFGLIIVTFVIIAVASGVISLLFAPLPDFFDIWLGSLVGHSLTVPFAAATLTTAYFQLTAPAPEPAAAAPPPRRPEPSYSGVTYAAVRPPSTRNVAAFTYDDSSLARKSAALTISRGFASRPIGRWMRRRS